MADKLTLDDLIKVSALAVTTTGRAPSSMRWEFTIDQVIDDTLNLVRGLVKEIQEVTIEYHPHTGNVMGFAWLPSNSEHLVDVSMKQIIGRTVQNYSKEVKELIEKYSPKNVNQTISPQKGTGNNLSAIVLDLERVLRVLMDLDGVYCRSQFGTFVKSNLELRAIFRDNSNTDKKLIGIEVTKTTKVNNYKRPKPNPNFRY